MTCQTKQRIFRTGSVHNSQRQGGKEVQVDNEMIRKIVRYLRRTIIWDVKYDQIKCWIVYRIQYLKNVWKNVQKRLLQKLAWMIEIIWVSWIFEKRLEYLCKLKYLGYLRVVGDEISKTQRFLWQIWPKIKFLFTLEH